MGALERDWLLRRSDVLPSELFDKYGKLLRSSLWSRNFEDEARVDDFLFPKLGKLESPFRLTQLESACERIAEALEAQERICIYGDYDIDGMSALSMLKGYFSLVSKVDALHYIPHRFQEGYGMNVSAVETLAKESVALIITVDTGITAHEPVQRANELGVDVIITDHHLPKSSLPNAGWIVNPNSGICESSLGYLAGSGVAFYLCMGMNIVLKRNGYFEKNKLAAPNLKSFLDLFALGTISDQMQLLDDNRALVKAGLGVLLKSERPGLRELIRQCVDLEKLSLSARDVGFSIAPKLNAASRMGCADLSVELLSCEDPALSRKLTEEIMGLNQQRVDIQADIYKQAFLQAEKQHAEGRQVVVAYGPWHEGVLGIVASKILDDFALPTIILGEVESVYKGSMRSTDALSSVVLLESCAEFLSRFGGHAAAAGLAVKEGELRNFQEAVWARASAAFESQQEVEAIEFDADLPDEIDIQDIEALELLSPFGPGNPEPLFCVRNLSLDRPIKILKDKHVKFKTDRGFEVIGFFKADKIKTLQELSCSHIDILVTPEINRFRGLSRIQLRLEYVRASSSPNSFS